jgi:hypothetical protein
MRFRKLRIAWSVAWGLACLLLIAAWVRSCWVEDFCEWSSQTRNYGAHSVDGLLLFERSMFFSVPFGFHWGELPARNWAAFTSWPRPMAGVSVHTWDRGWTAMVSYGWVLIITGLAALSPWTSLARRFSLRTLLIATTLVAVVLGLIVWLVDSLQCESIFATSESYGRWPA